MGGEKNDHLTGFLNIDGLFHMISSVYNGYIYIYDHETIMVKRNDCGKLIFKHMFTLFN